MVLLVKAESDEEKLNTLKNDLLLMEIDNIRSIVSNYSDRGIPFDDLFQEACLSLLVALENFDHNKSKDFKSLFSVLPVDIDEKYRLEDQGVFPLSIGVVSEVASSEAIKLLLGIGDLLLNKMLIINLLTHKYQIISYPD